MGLIYQPTAYIEDVHDNQKWDALDNIKFLQEYLFVWENLHLIK